MKVDKQFKKIKKLVKEYKNSKCKVKVYSLKRKHFKDELSTSFGFGYQDMKNKPKRLFDKMIKAGYNVYTEPVDINDMTVDLYVVL